jgi:hypothetical protein
LYVYLRKEQHKLIPKDKYDEAWNEVFRNKTKNPMSRKFQITKNVFLVLTTLIILAIPVASLIITANNWQGGCLFGASCPWWEFAGIIMFGISPKFIPFLVATSLVWIVMSVFQSLSRDSRRPKWIQAVLLVLVLLTVPFFLISMLNSFKQKLRVENNTSQILYLTLVQTYWDDSHPMVVPQNIAFRNHDIPVRPQRSVTLKYDPGKLPIRGIAVCKTDTDCRLLPLSYLHDYELNSYENLERLNPNWLTAIRSSPLHNYSNLIIIVLSLVPILLFSGWLYLNPR